MTDDYFKTVSIAFLVIVLTALAFLLVKPILIAILLGLFLAFIFDPLYKWINKKVKGENLSAFLVCFLLLIIVFAILWYLIPIMITQSVRVYLSIQNTDFVEILKNLIPSLFGSENFSNEIGPAINSFASKVANALISSFSKILINLPKIFLYVLVVLFTFFFGLRDGKKLGDYIKSLLPFSKDVVEKLFNSSKDITMSVLYGRILLGIAQGIIAGIGFFIFKVPNALLLTALASFAGILPIIGTVIIWLPVAIIFFIKGSAFTGWGIIAFGLLATFFESIVQPIILARMIKMNSSIALISMIGGLFFFGVIGVVLGPLIIAYLLIILDVYRNKKSPTILVEK